MKKEKAIPLHLKYNLTITEASEYFGIGEKKIRMLIQENQTADFILYNGIKTLIKRAKFEEFIDKTSSL